MSAIHPMLRNILSLANRETWQKSIDLADEALAAWLPMPQEIKQIYLVGHGSSLFNGLVGEYILEYIAGVPCKAVPAFAFSTYMEHRRLNAQTLVIGISTTGETNSVSTVVERARDAGSPTLAITAHRDSLITYSADVVIPTGGEDDQISVKTKSYIQALIPLYLIALRLSKNSQQRNHWLEQILLAAEGARQFLEKQQEEIKQLTEKFAKAPNVFVLGTGPNLGTAEEASLKIIEMAKMYSECQELEDFFHGRLREVDPNSPVFFIAPNGRSNRRVLDFLTVLDRIKAPSVVLTDIPSPGIQRLATHVIQIPISLDEYATPLLYVLPMHLFGYEMALQRGYDPTARRYNLVPQNVKYQEEE